MGGLCHTNKEYHLLATAHSLRALLTYETDPRSKVLISGELYIYFSYMNSFLYKSKPFLW